MSASSEILDSGRFSAHMMPARAPDQSNFSQTFNLLSQYLKENGTLGDLGLGMASSATATMNLFPVAEKSGSPPPTSLPQQDAAFAASPVSNQQGPKKQSESAQMTIFYGGQVVVLDDFPAEKAMEIMMLAGKGTSQKHHTFQPASDWIPKPTEPSNLAASTHKNSDKEGVQPHRPQPVVSDLPIARKASLTRFLEKRKERITARGPYQGENYGANGNPSKQDEGKAWLGLAAAESGMQFQPQS